jgi:uncharacterized membrane protein
MANIENGRGAGTNGRGAPGGARNGTAERAALSDDATAKGSNWREEDRDREAFRRAPPYRAAGEADERMGRGFRGSAGGDFRSEESRAAGSVQHTGELVGWERWATLIGGGLLVRHGLRHGGITGLASLAIGGVMAWAGANGRVPQAVKGLTGTREEGKLADRRGWSSAAATSTSITIARPAEELYGFWRKFSNLTRVLSHVESIEVIDDNRSRWTVKAPAGQTVSWEAVVTDDQKNRRIAWESAPGADVRNYGWIEFKPAPGDRGTEVKALIVYEPPGGQIGRLVAKLFMEEPGVQLRDDLRRFKQVMETSSTANAEKPKPM